MVRKIIVSLLLLLSSAGAGQAQIAHTAVQAATSPRDVIKFYVEVARLAVMGFEVAQQSAFETGNISGAEHDAASADKNLIEWYPKAVAAAKTLGVLPQLKAVRASELAIWADGKPEAGEMRFVWEARMRQLKSKHEAAIADLEVELQTK
ncbi:MAG: hypothetical protein AB1832_01115 [Pseudomonadota bacterium]